MNIQIIQERLNEDKIFDHIIKKYTLLVDDKMQEQGALFFIPFGSKEIKIVLPNPFHHDILKEKELLTYRQLFMQKEIILLK